MRLPGRSRYELATVSAADMRRAASSAGLTMDAAQLSAADALERVGSSGVYLWGPVGRGKSWLMDTYLELAPTSRKKRLHFHDFFAHLHTELHRHDHRLDAALDALLGGQEVLCFDEFQVDDPADGIFVRRLLELLLARPVRLILTSNQPPQGLMPNPLFHSTFESTIALIETSLEVVEVNGPVDYRTVTSGRNDCGFARGRWIFTADPAHLDSLGLPWPNSADAAVLTPHGHMIRALFARNNKVWFNFDDLCAQPTSAADYATIADDFPWWVVSGVPCLAEMGGEPPQRFAHLIDVLYDRGLRVDLISDSSACDFPLEAPAHANLARTTSRLHQLARIG